jgi:hypothetical protein
MRFDGSEIEVGDSVVDLVSGGGVVVLIQEEERRIMVQFGARKLNYSPEGIGNFSRKTLYWRDPIGEYAPMKEDSMWDTFVKIRDSVAQHLNIRKNGNAR